jgi:GT2 family glycosyltransferase
MPSDVQIEITVVDDGSTDETSEVVHRIYCERVTLIRHEERLGRSAARNRGAFEFRHDYILFLDSDCYLPNNDTVSVHLEKLRKRADLSVSPVQPEGDSFWMRYQRLSDLERQRAFKSGTPWALTSACFAISDKQFTKIGGFDEAFRYYGFEDRDLFLRAHQAGLCIVLLSEKPVSHDANISVMSLVRKMKEAGANSAPIFRDKHREIYREMSFGKIDVSFAHPAIRLMASLSSPFVCLFAYAVQLGITFNVAPFSVKRIAVRAITAVAYMYGTALHSRAGPKS